MQQRTPAFPPWLQRAILSPYEVLVTTDYNTSEQISIEELLAAAESALLLYRFVDAQRIAATIAEHPRRTEDCYRWSVLMLSAQLQLVAGNADIATHSFQESLLNTTNRNDLVVAHTLWARTLDSIGDYSAALESYGAALELVDPTDDVSIVIIRCGIASIVCMLGDREGAREILCTLYERLCQQDRQEERNLVQTIEAAITLSANKADHALEQIIAVRSSNNRQTNVHLSLYHDLLLLEAYIMLRRWDDAGSLGEALVTRSEELNLPYHAAAARYSYGKIYGDKDSPYYSPPLAIEQFKKALKRLAAIPLSDLAARIHLALAQTYQMIGHYQKAFVHLEEYTSHRNRIHTIAQMVKHVERAIAKHNHAIEISYHQARNQQLEELLSAARQQTEQYQQRMEEQIAYLGVVAHDLKNPIAAIMMSASIIGRYGQKLSTEDLEKHSNNIIHTAEWMKELVTSLLDFTALTTGRMKLTIEPVHTALLFDVVIEAYRLKALAKSLTIHKIYRHGDLYVLADSKRLQECLDNLLSNAIKYTPLGRNIYCIIEQQGEIVRLSVRDEGCGLTPEEQQQLFREFSRARSHETGKEGGTGLGLSIVRRLIEAMHGNVGCKSEIGKGSEFYIELPLASPTAANSRGQVQHPVAAPATQ